MIEKTVYDYLADQMDVSVYMERPEEVPSSWLLIEKTGGRGGPHLYEATIAIQSYAPTMFEAATLNEVVKAAMLAIPEYADDVTHCELNSDYNFTDTETKEYRYQAVFDIKHY